MRQYGQRDIMQLDVDGNYYARHIQAMTEEGLFSKSDIAGELAWRDMVIDDLKEEIALLRTKKTTQPTDTCKWKSNRSVWILSPHSGEALLQRHTTYCPTCGKRIEVTE